MGGGARPDRVARSVKRLARRFRLFLGSAKLRFRLGIATLCVGERGLLKPAMKCIPITRFGSRVDRTVELRLAYLAEHCASRRHIDHQRVLLTSSPLIRSPTQLPAVVALTTTTLWPELHRSVWSWRRPDADQSLLHDHLGVCAQCRQHNLPRVYLASRHPGPRKETCASVAIDSRTAAVEGLSTRLVCRFAHSKAVSQAVVQAAATCARHRRSNRSGGE